MPNISDLESIIDRIENGVHSENDLAILRRAIDIGSIKIEGDVTNSVNLNRRVVRHRQSNK